MPQTAQQLKSLTGIAAFLPVVLSLFVLFGWVANIPSIQSVWPGLPTMKVNTALCFALSGLSLWFWRRADTSSDTSPHSLYKHVAILCACLVLLISSVTLAEHIFNWNSGLDEFFLDVPITDSASPGRMSAATAFEFILLSLALLVMPDTERNPRISQSMSAIVLFVSLLVLLAYLFGASIERVGWFSTVAIHTAFSFFVLGIGVLCLRADKGWVSTFTYDSNSARIGRWFLFSTFLLLPLLAGLRLLGQKNFDMYGTYFGIALLTVSSITTLAVINWITTRAGNLADDEIRNLNRVYAVLSGINTLIVRVKTKEELFNETCRVACRVGKFPWAWIISIDPDTREKNLAAWGGGNKALVKSLQLRLTLDSDKAEKHSLIQLAIDTSQPVILNDMNDHKKIFKSYVMPSDELQQYGVQSMVLLPLIVESNLVGVFALHATSPHFFDEVEMRLLIELANDISFALHNIKKEESLNYLAYYDPLTNLANRPHFLDLLSRSLLSATKTSKRVCLILIDMKGFRAINETLGQSFGDELLKLIAQRLLGKVPQPETLSRLQSDCFATLMTIKSSLSIEYYINNLLNDGLKEPFYIAGQTLDIRTTLGIGIFPEDGNDSETLMKNTEATLKNAKETDRNYLFYKPEINSRVAELFKLENKLNTAVAQKQFILHYQPKYDVASNSFESVEALIRWNDPDTGLIPPDMFIPLLEKSGLILSVGEWVLHQAVSDINRWKEMGFKAPRVAVNVSSIQLREESFTETVINALAGFEEMKPMLDLEITESVLMENIQLAGTSLNALRNTGVEISIDDFGTGYSSLSYLVRLPINTLKIDRSFVQHMTESGEGLALVGAIISLAHSLKIKVVAEGVETEEQAQILQDMKCDLIQGHLLCRPVPFEELSKMLIPSENKD